MATLRAQVLQGKEEMLRELPLTVEGRVMKHRDPSKVPILSAKARKGSKGLYFDENQVTRLLELHSYL